MRGQRPRRSSRRHLLAGSGALRVADRNDPPGRLQAALGDGPGTGPAARPGGGQGHAQRAGPTLPGGQRDADEPGCDPQRRAHPGTRADRRTGARTQS